MNAAQKIWQEMLPTLETEVSTMSFDVWIQTLEPFDIEGDRLILIAPTEGNRAEILNNLRPLIRAVLTSVNPLLTDITVLLRSDVEQRGGFNMPQIEEEPETVEHKSLDALLINPRYTFDNFVVGECNRFAVAAARAVSENPGQQYNPLFIYGGPGLGKTHIMHAIGNYIRKNNQHMKVLYVSSEKFVNELIASIRGKGGSTEKFREKYRSADVLMIDDIQFISKKESTQVEMFHTFNELHQMNKQVIFASDRPPKEIPELEERLRSRFEWGLIADVQPPDLETRIAILQKKSQIEKVNVGQDVLNFMAQRCEGSIREMESMLNKVIFLSKLYALPITLDLAEEAFKDYEKPVKEAVDAEDIIEATLKLYPNVTKADLLGKKRTKEIVEPRMICIYLIAEMLPLPLTAIGEMMGGRDHTTIMHSKDKVTSLIAKDERIKKMVSDIRNMATKN